MHKIRMCTCFTKHLYPAVHHTMDICGISSFNGVYLLQNIKNFNICTSTSHILCTKKDFGLFYFIKRYHFTLRADERPMLGAVSVIQHLSFSFLTYRSFKRTFSLLWVLSLSALLIEINYMIYFNILLKESE